MPDEVRSKCISLRKAGKTGPLSGKGPGKLSEDGIPPNLSPELLAHYESQEYRNISEEVIARAYGRCQICNAIATECHHRSYEEVKGPGEIDDLIAVCRECHRFCDRRRRIEAAKKKGQRIYA